MDLHCPLVATTGNPSTLGIAPAPDPSSGATFSPGICRHSAQWIKVLSPGWTVWPLLGNTPSPLDKQWLRNGRVHCLYPLYCRDLRCEGTGKQEVLLVTMKLTSNQEKP